MIKTLSISIITSSILLATNGDNMISLGAESRAMGGTGVAMYMGTDSVFRNPAWLADIKNAEVMFGATFFMPDVTAKNGNANNQKANSASDKSLIPEVSAADKINDNFSYGVGMFGVSGMGVDYRNEDPQKGLSDMRSSFQFIRFVPAIAYKNGDYRVGVGLTVAYGALGLSARLPKDQNNPTDVQQIGGGSSESFGYGAQFGLGYSINSEYTTGIYYQTKVDITYDAVMDFDMDGRYDDLKLSQPAEYGIGIAYKKDKLKATAEYRKILWSDADGYDKFGWEDQEILALGVAYKKKDIEYRGGYSYAKSPLDDAKFNNPSIAFFNIMGFPAISKQHFTAGLGYKLSKNVGFDFAYVYSPRESKNIMNMEATNKQSSITGALKYKFYF